MSEVKKQDKAPSGTNTNVDLLEHFRERYALHREVTDRWFSYYLLIMAGPIPLLAAVLPMQGVLDGIRKQPGPLATIGILFFILGVIFLCMQTQQRMNSLRLLWTIFTLEAPLLIAVGLGDEPAKRPNRFGADFTLGVIHSFVNSIWLGGALYLLTSKFWIAVVALAISVGVQTVLRVWKLWALEGSPGSPNRCTAS
jgi:hypothetical protein